MINPFFLPNNSVILLHKKTEFLGYIWKKDKIKIWKDEYIY